ncbi:MAG TPA: NHL repeat-containing protein [Candidatus Hydrogenedentes bacterium]|nr:NHL repeat-containing protein [Candidatus Hydrogenedentota bacterium]HPG65789.1 NHL repeat-containing protein [Candidatus Hydrogenedentota bacterium]
MQYLKQSRRAAIAVAFLGVVLTALQAVGAWQDGQNAEYVVGQTDFTSNASGTSSTTLSYCISVAIDSANAKLYVSDYLNDRVLRYAYPVTTNGQAAELVFGQSDFVSTDGGSAANQFSSPTGIAVDASGRLWVADNSNSRVVWFDDAYALSGNASTANGVLGQAAFNQWAQNRGGSPAANTMSFPYGVYVDATDCLWVADTMNHRVLWFEAASSVANGADADGTLGQSDFASISANRGGTPGADTLSGPRSVTVDSNGRLWVSDTGNNRVLRFDNAGSLTSGTTADAVLGQADFSGNAMNRGGSVAANTMAGPMGISADGAGRLYVVDQQNRRVLIFSAAASKANGADADNLLGQSSFTVRNAATTQSGLDTPFGLALGAAAGKLVAADMANNRVLQFDAGMTLPVTVSGFQVE